MNTYFNVYYSDSPIRYNNRQEAIAAIENTLNQDLRIPKKILEIDSNTNQIAIVYKPEFSVKLIWTDIPKYNGDTLIP